MLLLYPLDTFQYTTVQDPQLQHRHAGAVSTADFSAYFSSPPRLRNAPNKKALHALIRSGDSVGMQLTHTSVMA